jgi:2-polyprenyl-3-methyl-5-hydroxy-6-metoxy-1,4-benzoquinol methylase
MDMNTLIKSGEMERTLEQPASIRDFASIMRSETVQTISPQCEMYRFASSRFSTDAETRDYYFETGFELANNLCEFLKEVGTNPYQEDLLDYAAGYGRVTRYFVPVFKSVTAADIAEDMITFHSQTLGIEGWVSPPDPAGLRARTDRYDVVFVFSLFTHLPRDTWSKWLAAIFSMVKENGYLVFSTHSYELFELIAPGKFDAKHKRDFVFWEANETEGRLPTSAYGCNIVTEKFVRKELSRLKTAEFIRRYRKGEFDRYHDIYIARKKCESARQNIAQTQLSGESSMLNKLFSLFSKMRSG